MYLRNLMAIDTEEMIRAQPMDACVLIDGCDKTVPALPCGRTRASPERPDGARRCAGRRSRACRQAPRRDDVPPSPFGPADHAARADARHIARVI
jgi:hypothetical protein